MNKFSELALEMLEESVKAGAVDIELAKSIRQGMNSQTEQKGIEEQRSRVAKLKDACQGSSEPVVKRLMTVADYLVKKSVWILGGDGWAYDIGYGGLDHVLASGENVNVLVLDTEVYSNTGGQMSKSTPRGAVAKFAAAGKKMPKKDMGLISMSYGGIYVAKVAMGANPNQTVKAFVEAESYDGPSIILAYSHCIAHGINMSAGYLEQKKAVSSGYWPLYRYDPRVAASGKNPLMLDSKAASTELEDYVYGENRYRQLKKSNPERAAALFEQARKDVEDKWSLLEKLSNL